MSIDGFLRTEAKARQANDDGIWELLVEAAEEIERLNVRNKELFRAVNDLITELTEIFQVKARAAIAKAKGGES